MPRPIFWFGEGFRFRFCLFHGCETEVVFVGSKGRLVALVCSVMQFAREFSFDNDVTTEKLGICHGLAA